jgi:hypothetical protein
MKVRQSATALPSYSKIRVRVSIVREIADEFPFAPHLSPLHRESLRGGGEETMDSYFPHDAKAFVRFPDQELLINKTAGSI